MNIKKKIINKRLLIRVQTLILNREKVLNLIKSYCVLKKILKVLLRNKH